MQTLKLLIMLFASLISFNLNAQDAAFSLENLEIKIEARSNRIYLGEKYSAIFSFNQKIPDNYSVMCVVNGANLMVKDQKANYTATGARIGEKKYIIKISVKDSKGDFVRNWKREVSYDVTVPHVHVIADKMNVFYVGVDNPITIVAPDIDPSKMEVEIYEAGAKIRKIGGSRYIITCKKSGSLTLTIRDNKRERAYPFKYRVKQIPRPFAKLGKHMGGEIRAKTFVEQPGIAAWLENFDFDARCSVKQYKILHYTKRKKMKELVNTGGRFEAATLVEIQKAKVGDIYIFMEIEGTCPGNAAIRPLNDLVFKIK